jgi:hypothetical protein
VLPPLSKEAVVEEEEELVEEEDMMADKDRVEDVRVGVVRDGVVRLFNQLL